MRQCEREKRAKKVKFLSSLYTITHVHFLALFYTHIVSFYVYFIRGADDIPPPGSTLTGFTDVYGIYCVQRIYRLQTISWTNSM